jgi:heat-inducible transcriptional repressor
MGARKQGPEFDERMQMVLRGIIDSYIDHSEPVGSRTLSRQLEVQLSPATIRNIMSDLSELGFLTQPHTSGGRIPTDKAYRYYVDTLVVANQLPSHIERHLQELSLLGSTSPVEALLQNTSRVLAGLTQFVCLVTAPKSEVSRLQRIEFIKISARKILVILVTKSGIIRNKIIDTPEELAQEFLNTISAFLNDQFRNHSLSQIREEILRSMVEDKERYDQLLAQAVRLGKKAFEADQPEVLYMEGQFNLLKNERLRDSQSAQQLMDAFEHKSAIMSILDDTLNADGVKIFIGIENETEGLQECSLVTANYQNENNILGSIGVIGPTSMNYQQIIPVVDYTAKILSKAISEQAYD